MACWPAARSRAARSWRNAFGTCGMRAAGVPRRAENGNTWRWVNPASSISAQVRSNIASVSVGKPGDQIGAEGDVRPQPPQARAQADHVVPVVPPLHALQDQVVAGLNAEMQMRHQAGLARDQIGQIPVDLGRIDGGQPQSRQVRHEAQQTSDQLAERGLPRQVLAVRGQVDPGQHDLAVAAFDPTARSARPLRPPARSGWGRGRRG